MADDDFTAWFGHLGDDRPFLHQVIKAANQAGRVARPARVRARRFTGSRMFSHAAETRAQKLVAVQFFLLAPYVAVESGRALIGGDRPDETWVGIALATSSVVLMPLLGIAKQRIADQIGSAATKGEGRQNMLCAYLAGALLVGLVGNMVVGAWWLDPGVGLLIAAVAVKEGLEAWRGEGCCVSSPLDGAGFEDDACTDDCCAH